MATELRSRAYHLCRRNGRRRRLVAGWLVIGVRFQCAEDRDGRSEPPEGLCARGRFRGTEGEQ